MFARLLGLGVNIVGFRGEGNKGFWMCIRYL